MLFLRSLNLQSGSAFRVVTPGVIFPRKLLVWLAFNGFLLQRPLCRSLAPADLFRRVHGPAALFCPAVAERLVVAAIVETVVIRDFFARCNVANSLYPDPPTDFVGLAVGITTVIDEHRHAMSVDDDRAVSKSKEVGDGRLLVRRVGFVLAEARTGIFRDAGAFSNRSCGVAAGRMNGRRANDESHGYEEVFLELLEVLYAWHRNIEVAIKKRNESCISNWADPGGMFVDGADASRAIDPGSPAAQGKSEQTRRRFAAARSRHAETLNPFVKFESVS